jgi:hypothetical protein
MARRLVAVVVGAALFSAGFVVMLLVIRDQVVAHPDCLTGYRVEDC